MKIKNIALSGLMALGCLTASAQNEAKTEYVFTPHWYVQAQIGGQYTLGEISTKDLLSPNVQLGVGYEFNKVVGARFSVNAWQGKAGLNKWGFDGAANEIGRTYKWKWNYVAPMIDATVNLTNLFCDYNPNRLITAGVFAGVGANIAFKNDEANELPIKNDLAYLWDGTKVRFAARFGANVDFRLSDRVKLGIETHATTLNDHFNSKRAGNADWQFTTLVGVKVRLGKGKGYTTREIKPVAPVERVIERIVEKPVPVVEKVEQPVVKQEVAQEKLRQDIFFIISSNQISASEAKKIDEIVAFMNKYPNSRVTVTGYADKGTGNDAINDRIAARRAKVVVDALVKKGISSSRITSESKGSRVQPYAENNKNRVTICIAE